MTLLARLVEVSERVAATSSRSAKVALLAGLLRELGPDEIGVGVGLLAGTPRQGRVGVGFQTLRLAVAAAALTPTLTLAELDAAISAIAGAEGAGSAAERRGLLGDLFARATPAEGAFVRRLLGGALRQGASAGIVSDAVAVAAGVPAELLRRALMLSGDLPHAAQLALGEGSAGLEAVGLELFRPLLPMLASTAASLEQALAGFTCSSVEWKLDGIRIQIHRRGDEVRVYTRNLNDITHALPGVVSSAAALPVRSAVLDGEALWMSGGRPATFQGTVARIDRDAPAEGTVAFVFDVLHLDGADLLEHPLRERIARLEQIAPALRIPGVLTSQPGEAHGVLASALAAGHEGVVVKDADAPYVAGRRGQSWLKLKPVRSYDLVVLAAEWGHGRRQGWLSNLHLGARDPERGGFVMVGKCFKGLTDALLAWQTVELLARESGRRGITVSIRPELVVEIAIDGVQASRRYGGGVALRFARVRRYRPDKDAADADTIGELRALLPAG